MIVILVFMIMVGIYVLLCSGHVHAATQVAANSRLAVGCHWKLLVVLHRRLELPVHHTAASDLGWTSGRRVISSAACTTFFVCGCWQQLCCSRALCFLVFFLSLGWICSIYVIQP